MTSLPDLRWDITADAWQKRAISVEAARCAAVDILGVEIHGCRRRIDSLLDEQLA